MKTPKQYIILLIALLCLGALSTSGQTIPTAPTIGSYTHYYYNGYFYTDSGHTVSTGWSTFNELLTEYAGNPVVRLDSDFNNSGNIAIASGKTLTIDLFDHCLRAATTVTNLFAVDGTLNIFDIPGNMDTDNTVKFLKPDNSIMANTSKVCRGKIIGNLSISRCIWVEKGGVVNLISGTIMGTETEVIVPIYNDGYMRNIMGGLDKAKTEGGGAVGLAGGGIYGTGTFNMWGGVITKCSSGKATFPDPYDPYDPYNPTNTTTGGSGNGGAISIGTGSTANIYNGAIRFCQAGNLAGAINNSGTCSIYDGKFEYNATGHDFGCFLYLWQGGRLDIYGGEFRYVTGGGMSNGLGNEGILIQSWSASSEIPATLNVYGGTFEKSSGRCFYFGGAVNLTATFNGSVYEKDILIQDNYRYGIGMNSVFATVNVGARTKILNNNPGVDAAHQNPNGGGILLTKGTLNLEGAVEIAGNQAVRGGGIYADGGNGTLTLGTGLNIHDNSASDNGGGIYVKNNITMNDGTIKDNTATNYGGGICVETPFEVTVNLLGGTIDGNSAADGGGLAVLEVELPTGPTYTEEWASNWGVSVFSLEYPAEDWDTSLGDALVIDNQGSYVPEQVSIDGHIMYIGSTLGNGGPPYGSGPIHVTYRLKSAQIATVNVGNGSASPTIQNNSASGNGGGIFTHGGVVNVNAATAASEILLSNEAVNGGGLFTSGGTVNFSKGTIKNNYASEKGGGLYIPAEGTLNLTGTSTLTGNHVAAGHLGGGVYLAGTLKAGSSSSDVITVADNYAGTSTILNNVYLPNPKDDVTGTPTTYPGVISVVNGGLNLSSSSIGFSVPHNLLPVVYCSDASYLASNWNTNALFEDGNKYTKYYSTESPYKGTFIYLSADTWVRALSSQPEGFAVDGSGNVTISSAQGLAWLISYVNGRTDLSPAVAAHNMSGKTVTLTADVDMAGHVWVPIGIAATGAEKTFKGTFNGNGHSISNLSCSFLGDDASGTGLGLGMFGVLDGAEVHDVILNGMEIQVSNQTGSDTYVMGAIANETKNGTNIYNCYASPVMTSTMANTIMGGLVGKLTSGTLKNSFANARFVPASGATFKGGLVGENSGTVENCYVRVQATVPATDYFGYLAGTNASGILQYCYSPVATYVSTNGTAGTQTGLGTYGTTSRLNGAYSYLQSDQQITLAVANSNSHVLNGNFSSANGLTGLLYTLNHWANSSEGGAQYARWMRTSASPINDDYPIFKYDDCVCVGSTDNIALDYSNDFSTMFSSYVGSGTSGVGTIYLYNNAGTSTISTSNSGKATALYIGEDAVLLHNSAIDAHVGIVLDNSAGTNGANPTGSGITDAIDWHFFSSALTAAKIGLTYNPTTSVLYGATPEQTTFTASGATTSYFPTNLDSYYGEWDLYGYCERDYHWINYKRNSLSHWHEDLTDCQISYTNHTDFQPGYGYMVALAREGYLQATGTLNTHAAATPLEVPVTCSPVCSWTGRDGLNLLGNPYQSYLDFNAFADVNKDLWVSGTRPYYIVMDEEKKNYVIYTRDASYNPDAQASRYIHPHQGFMIKSEKDGTAKFHNGMRTTTMDTGWTSSFRDGGSQPNYPLVNLFATDVNGNRDIVTVELDRPETGGVPKSKVLSTGMGRLSCHYEGENYALAFTEPGLESANIRFSTGEDGEYTMTWSTANGEFNYLHLIDNMTGTDIDCLQKTEYGFTARTTDYESRFRLVFDYTGVEENGEEALTNGSGTFAYYANGEIHLMETQNYASLQIIDMTGRVIVSRDGVHTVSTNGMAPGVYVLRLTTDKGTRTQKIILN